MKTIPVLTKNENAKTEDKQPRNNTSQINCSKDLCEDCGGQLEHAEGCVLCKACGYTKC